MHYILLYDYGPDVAERRSPYREEHLGLLKGLYECGQVLMAGPWTDPLDGAAIIFDVETRGAVEEFVRADPYVANGIVAGWRIREWNVVIGGKQNG